MFTRIALFSLCLISMLACDDQAQAPTAGAPLPPRNGRVAFLSVSDLSPPVGSNVVVTARVASTSGLRGVGSFVAELRFDHNSLVYTSTVELPSGMRVVNPKAGVVYAAGASAGGFVDDRLFAVVVRVSNPAALAGLDLRITELNGTDLTSQLGALRMSPGLVSAQGLAQ